MSPADASSLSLWSALSVVGLVLVIIGVVMEGAEALIWALCWFRRKRLSVIWTMLPEPHIPRWAHRLDHFGWFILVIGLALETWGHIRVTDITGRENRRLTAKLDSTTQIAGAAIERAAITDSNNLVLESNTLILRSNIFALERNMVPRTIEVAGPGSRLRQFSGTKVLIIVGSCNDCAGFSAQLKYGLFMQAGWNCDEIIPTTKSVPVGISVGWCMTNDTPTDRLIALANGSDKLAQAASALVDEFDNNNIAAKKDDRISEETSLKFDGLLILIGSNPVGVEADIFGEEAKIRQLNNDLVKLFFPNDPNSSHLMQVSFLSVMNANHPEVKRIQNEISNAETDLRKLENKQMDELDKNSKGFQGVHLFNVQVNPPKLP